MVMDWPADDVWYGQMMVVDWPADGVWNAQLDVMANGNAHAY